MSDDDPTRDDDAPKASKPSARSSKRKSTKRKREESVADAITELASSSQAEATPEPEAPKPQPKKATKYVVAAGRSITTGSRLMEAGDEITPADVGSFEALLNAGVVVAQ